MGKDWVGDYNGVFKCLGARNGVVDEREAHDYYATEPKAIDALLSVVDVPHRVWEPCCGAGHLSRRLVELCHDVVSSDVVDRGYGDVADFFEAELPRGVECIVTNPPYKHLTDFIVRALSLLPVGGLLCLFMKTQSLEGKERWERVYRVTPPRFVYQFIARMVCAKNGDFAGMKRRGGSAVSYAWYVWEKWFNGDTILRWL